MLLKGIHLPALCSEFSVRTYKTPFNIQHGWIEIHWAEVHQRLIVAGLKSFYIAEWQRRLYMSHKHVFRPGPECSINCSRWPDKPAGVHAEEFPTPAVKMEKIQPSWFVTASQTNTCSKNLPRLFKTHLWICSMAVVADYATISPSSNCTNDPGYTG